MMKDKPTSVILLAGIYGVVISGCSMINRGLAGSGPVIAMLAADIAATLLIWIVGLILRNASVYDPYWSVVPPFMVIGWMRATGGLHFASVLLLIALLIWAVRLTVNFAIGWRGLEHQDWRYGMLKDKNPKLWIVTNLFGINLFPTLVVFACMIPAYIIISSFARVGLLFSIGFLMCIGAAAVQLVADKQMRAFRKTKEKGGHIESGLWRISRHPNYLGEVLMWWGVWVMQMGTTPDIWLTILAPIAMTAMFLFISIPMMETHIAEKCPGYAEYQARVGVLLPNLGRKEAYDEARG